MRARCGRCGEPLEYRGERALRRPHHFPGDARMDLDRDGHIYVVCERCEMRPDSWHVMVVTGAEA